VHATTKSTYSIDWYLLYVLFTFVLFFSTFFFSAIPALIYIPLGLAVLPISVHAFKKLREGILGTEFFLVIATAIALIGQQERAITIVLLIMLVAEYLAGLIERRTEDALESLIKLIPQQVLVKTDTGEQIVPTSQVHPGMQVIITTGGALPVDGVITTGNAEINESSLTGESAVKYKQSGDIVYAGTFVESGSITVRVEKVGESTFFGALRTQILQAEESQARVSVLADRVAAWLVPALLLFIVVTWVLTGDINLVVTLLVFGSPVELTLITPLAVLAGVVAAFRQGILVKGGRALEQLAYADTYVFDKTGTLTAGTPVVVHIESTAENYSTKDVLKIAAIAQKRSGHVLGKAIQAQAAHEHMSIPDPDEYTSLAGYGIEITYQGIKYRVGNRHFIEAPEHGGLSLEHIPMPAEYANYTILYVADVQHVLGMILISDALRPEAQQVIAYLMQAGIRVFLLSGDRKSVVKYTARLLGITYAYGELFPDNKLEIIKQLQEQGSLVAMVGDGINDAPALQQASVGIALGAMGMEPAIYAADVVLMTNNLEKIVFLQKLSKAVLKTIWNNIIFGFLVVHIVGIVFAFWGLISPVQAALLHGICDWILLVNSARLIRFKA